MPGSFMFPPDYTPPAGQMLFVANDAGRNAAVPEKVGQILFQENSGTYYFADGLAAGEWLLEPTLGAKLTAPTLKSAAGGLIIGGGGSLTFDDGTNVITLDPQSGGDATVSLPHTTGTLNITP